MCCCTRVVRTAALIRDGPAGDVRSATRALRLRAPHSTYATPLRLAAPSRREHTLVTPASPPSCFGRGLWAARLCHILVPRSPALCPSSGSARGKSFNRSIT